MKLLKPLLPIFCGLFFSLTSIGQVLPEPVASSSEDLIKGKALYLAVPKYPATARAVRASGEVNVLVKIDKQGTVIFALAQTGHPLLRAAAEAAARESKFSPTIKDGKAVEVSGTISFFFSRFEEKITWEQVGSVLVTNLHGNSGAGKPYPKAAIWTGFEQEFQELNELKEISNSVERQKIAATLINRLRLKLKQRDALALWYFDMGIADGGLSFNVNERSDGQDFFQIYLKDIARLVQIIPSEIPASRRAKLIEIAEYAKQSNISKEKRNEIIITLAEIRNLSTSLH